MEYMKVLIEKLASIQSTLKAPKNQKNAFGKYNYRSCEDILEAVKPLLWKHWCALIESDEVVHIWWFNYVKATAILYHDWATLQTTAFAKEPEIQKGMSPSQITGSASSYARKYALNWLFAIDDTKDADVTNDGSWWDVATKKQDMVPLTTYDGIKKVLKDSSNTEALNAAWRAVRVLHDKDTITDEQRDELKKLYNERMKDFI